MTYIYIFFYFIFEYIPFYYYFVIGLSYVSKGKSQEMQ